MQARLCSTRLPGKAFFTFFGQNMIERACTIAKEIKGVDRIILATGDKPENHSFQPYAENMGVEFFIGSEDNVLERFYQAIETYQGEYLLRMTCDNYLIQPEVVESLHQIALKENADYAYIEPLSHFSGEIVRCDAIRNAFESGYSPEAKEHVTWDIRKKPGYKVKALPNDFCGLNHDLAITLDTLNDLLLMKKLEHQYPAFSPVRCLDALKRAENELTTALT